MNVKKGTSLFLALLLLVSNVGVAFNVHYCGGAIAGIRLYSDIFSSGESDGCCEQTKVVKTKTCCKDKVIHFEKKSDDATVKMILFELATPFVVPVQQFVSFSLTPNFKKTVINDFYVAIHAPPLYQLYHQYIFYA